MTLIGLFSPQPMHIPDGFLSILVSIFLWIFSTMMIAYSLRSVSTRI